MHRHCDFYSRRGGGERLNTFITSDVRLYHPEGENSGLWLKTYFWQPSDLRLDSGGRRCFKRLVCHSRD